jgi:PEP-CTERM motif
MNLQHMIRAAAVVFVATASIGAAHAIVIVSAPPAPTAATYTINLPHYAVTDIIAYNAGSPFGTFAQGPSGTPLTAASPGPTNISETFPTFVAYTPGESFLLGVTSDLPGDAPGQQHLVVFTNNTFASNAISIAFGTLFPNTNETTLINDLTSETNPGDIFGFAAGDALSGPNGSIYFTAGDSFTAVAFSDGQIIGTGTSSFVTAAPEPITLSLFGAGLVGVVSMRRRKMAKLG